MRTACERAIRGEAAAPVEACICLHRRRLDLQNCLFAVQTIFCRCAAAAGGHSLRRRHVLMVRRRLLNANHVAPARAVFKCHSAAVSNACGAATVLIYFMTMSAD